MDNTEHAWDNGLTGGILTHHKELKEKIAKLEKIIIDQHRIMKKMREEGCRLCFGPTSGTCVKCIFIGGRE